MPVFLHNIYILDNPYLKQINLNFLNYIKSIQDILKDMNVKIIINTFSQKDVYGQDFNYFLQKYSIAKFPVLMTNNKIYQGIKNIVVIYNENIKEYSIYLQKKQKAINDANKIEQNLQQMGNKPSEKTSEKITNKPTNKVTNKREDILNNNTNEDEDRIFEYFKNEINIPANASTYDEEDSIFEDKKSSLMDSYNVMINKRNSAKKNIRSSNFRTLETTNKPDQKSNMTEKENSIITDNIKEEDDNIKLENDVDDVPINIDPSTIERDEDYDMQDDLLEKAYWNRISETKG
jgi:hypothetical protein